MISVHRVAAWAAWVCAVGLMLAGTISVFVSDTYAWAFTFLSHGLLVSTVAAVLTIRTFLEEHRSLVIEALRVGRDQGATVRKMRP